MAFTDGLDLILSGLDLVYGPRGLKRKRSSLSKFGRIDTDGTDSRGHITEAASDTGEYFEAFEDGNGQDEGGEEDIAFKIRGYTT